MLQEQESFDFLNQIPLSENPLTKAFRAAFASPSSTPKDEGMFPSTTTTTTTTTTKFTNDKIQKFVGPFFSSKSKDRDQYYSPLSRSNLYEFENNNNNNVGNAISKWKAVPEYACCTATSIPKNDDSPAPTRDNALNDIVEACTRIYEELLDVKENPIRVESTNGKQVKRKILVSFNGGKDCMVNLHLVCSMIPLNDIQKHFLFFVHESGEQKTEEHEDAISFRDWIMNDVMKVEFRICRGRTLKEHLADLLNEFSINICLIGTRKTDPAGKYQAGCLSPTSKDWPKVLLVSPIFRWSYGLIWEYTLNLDVPRCILYDQGYTSLGPKHLTTPNSVLKKDFSNGEHEPAWRLKQFSAERENRTSIKL